LGTTMDTIPRQTPYLRAPARADLPPAPTGQLRVGLVWAGNPGHHDDAVRSLRLEALAPLLLTPGTRFYSLQIRVPERDQSYLERSPVTAGMIGCNPDYLDTASLVQQLDLIITVDTSVAHLAGALGKPVWTFIQFSPDWRWFMERSDTVWYPSMRLFRQPQRDSWTPVIERMARELRQLIERKK